MTDEQMIADVLLREGMDAYTHDVAGGDPPTKYGVTQDALAAHRGVAVTPDDVKALGLDEAKDIYRQHYLMEPGIAKIPNEKLRALVFDAAVNQGPKTAIRMLQRALNVADDGVIGSKTMAAMPYLDARIVGVRFLHERALHYAAVCIAHPVKLKYLRGWLNRTFAQVEGLLA